MPVLLPQDIEDIEDIIMILGKTKMITAVVETFAEYSLFFLSLRTIVYFYYA